MRFIAPLFALALAGCGASPEEACQDYIDAWIACIGEAYADDAATAQAYEDATAGTCDVYDGMSGSEAKEAADLLSCYADTIDAGDCSTPEAYAATVSSITTDCL